MDDSSDKSKKQLKRMAHALKPVLQVGHKGVTESYVGAVDKALKDHELIKIKFMDFKESRRDLAEEIAVQTGSVLVDIIGNIAVLYRKNKSED